MDFPITVVGVPGPREEGSNIPLTSPKGAPVMSAGVVLTEEAALIGELRKSVKVE
jgi:hypothetical protein